MARLRLVRVTAALLPRFQARLEGLEQLAEYPLGTDTFRLSHGADYFAFFSRMGAVAYYALVHGDDDNGDVVAVGCGMLRPATRTTTATLPARWYVADLKVHPAWRGQRLPLRMLRGAFVQNYLRCPRGYGVAMDPADGRTPPALRSFRHFPVIAKTTSTRAFSVDLWSSTSDELSRVLPLLVAARGAPRFVALDGVKDLVLQSTKARLPLVHLSWSDTPAPSVSSVPREGAVHMWSTARESPLRVRLLDLGLGPTATATVLAHRLPSLGGDDIETAEI
jgi:GNAT superfamily N-acetyltransferase